MAKQAAASAPKPSMSERFQTFIHEIKVEMSKVAWPTKQDIKAHTTIVFVLLGILGVIVGTFDFVFQNVVLLILRLAAGAF